MKKRLFLFLFIICALFSGYAVAQDVSKLNLSWKYQPDAPLQLQWDIYQPQGQMPVLLLQLTPTQPARTNALSAIIHYRDSLSASTSLHQETIYTATNKGESSHNILHSVDTTRGANWLLLEFRHGTDSLRSYWYSLHMPSLKHFGLPDFYLQKQSEPLLSPFTLVKDPFAPQFNPSAQPNSLADSLFVFVYSLDLAPASTPMTMAPNASGNKMEIDKRIIHPAQQLIEPDTKGFYFLQTDTFTLAGQGVRAENKYYPKTRTIEAFAGPIRYLSTNEEWTELERENFSKQALDRYWLRMTQSEDKARKIIRSYYRRVTQANRLFTSFKEGWKTDMGMVYVLYGPPDDVYQQNDGELWRYNAKGDIPEISFTFARAVNPFDPKYYQLVRSKDYARTHFQTVSKWRRGQILP